MEGRGKRVIQKEETKCVDSEVRKEIVASSKKKVDVAGAQRTRVRGMCYCPRYRQEVVFKAVPGRHHIF